MLLLYHKKIIKLVVVKYALINVMLFFKVTQALSTTHEQNLTHLNTNITNTPLEEDKINYLEINEEDINPKISKGDKQETTKQLQQQKTKHNKKNMLKLLQELSLITLAHINTTKGFDRATQLVNSLDDIRIQLLPKNFLPKTLKITPKQFVSRPEYFDKLQFFINKNKNNKLEMEVFYAHIVHERSIRRALGDMKIRHNMEKTPKRDMGGAGLQNAILHLTK